MYRVSIGITTGLKPEIADWVSRNAERLLAHGVWIGEDIGRGPDPFVLAAMILLRTRTVRVGTGILPVVTHGFDGLARSSASLAMICNDRFALGIGIGGTRDLLKRGLTVRRPVSLLRSTVLDLRRVWSGERITVTNEMFNLTGYKLGMESTPTIPIFLGVRGPQMLRLAGEIADGVILSGPIDYIGDAIRIVNDSARHNERGPIEIVVWQPIIPLVSDEEDLARTIVAIIVADTPQGVMNMIDVDPGLVRNVKRAVTEGGPAAGAEFVDSTLVDAFVICGSTEEIVDKFDEFAGMGATEVVIGPPFVGEWKKTVGEIIEEARTRH